MRKLNVLLVFAASFVWSTQAAAGPVVRQATGTNAAAIQVAVDLLVPILETRITAQRSVARRAGGVKSRGTAAAPPRRPLRFPVRC